ncbi:MAG: hypothetical protein HY291_23135 [Planctomycetes bacterium]|nr:hypothetical protein [Planctomycetota bacterium]
MRGIALFALLACIAPLTAWAQSYQDEAPFTPREDLQDPFVLVRSRVGDGKRVQKKDEDFRRLVDERMTDAQQAGETARDALADGHSKDAFDLSERGLKALQDLEAGERAEVYFSSAAATRLRESLLTLREAARRLHVREQTESAFHALNVRLSGVVVGEKRSSAVVNGAVLGAGDFLPVNGQPSEVRIVEIRAGLVIVSFRGLKLPLTVQ